MPFPAGKDHAHNTHDDEDERPVLPPENPLTNVAASDANPRNSKIDPTQSATATQRSDVSLGGVAGGGGEGC